LFGKPYPGTHYAAELTYAFVIRCAARVARMCVRGAQRYACKETWQGASRVPGGIEWL